MKGGKIIYGHVLFILAIFFVLFSFLEIFRINSQICLAHNHFTFCLLMKLR